MLFDIIVIILFYNELFSIGCNVVYMYFRKFQDQTALERAH